MSRDDEEARERRQAAEDDIAMEKDYERRRWEHDRGICDMDRCRFCAEEWEAAIRENQGW